MTPYAVLLVKPTDGDAVIRKRFHQMSQQQHPDRPGAAGQPGPKWFILTEAYGKIKTEGLRAALAKSIGALSGVCKDCRGLGVKGSRIGGGKITACVKCGGEGRAR